MASQLTPGDRTADMDSLKLEVAKRAQVARQRTNIQGFAKIKFILLHTRA